MKWLLLVTSLFLIGCCASETIIKDRIVKIAVPPIHDTIYARIDTEINLNDYMAVIEGERIVEHDTVIKIKYYPVRKVFDISVKPESLSYHRIDTVKTTIVEVQKTPLLSKLGLVLIGMLIAGGFAFAVKRGII